MIEYVWQCPLLAQSGHTELECEIRVRRGGRIDHFETVRQRKDGSLIVVSLTVSPVKNAEGKIVGASKIARDITEQKRSQQQIATLAREATVGHLSASIAHEIRQMSAIGTKRTLRVALHMSACGDKADMPFCTANVCF